MYGTQNPDEAGSKALSLRSVAAGHRLTACKKGASWCLAVLLLAGQSAADAIAGPQYAQESAFAAAEADTQWPASPPAESLLPLADPPLAELVPEDDAGTEPDSTSFPEAALAPLAADDPGEDQDPTDAPPPFVPLREDMGYQRLEGADGPVLIYNPSQDQTLPFPGQPDSAMADYVDMQKQQTRALFNHFLATRLTPTQHALLRKELEAHFQQGTATDSSASRRGGGAGSAPLDMDTLTSTLLALYYYSVYVQDPLLEFADRITQSGSEGLVALRIIAMSHYLLSHFASVQPFAAMAQHLMGSGYLFYRHYSEGRTSMALAAGSYAALLALAAQVSATVLLRHSTFSGHAAGMFSSAWYHWQNRQYKHAFVDGLLALNFSTSKRRLLYSAAAVLLASVVPWPPPTLPGARFASANYLMPVFLAGCMSEDWLSSTVTAALLLANQHLLYATRAFFLEPGGVWPDSEPWWPGITGASLAAVAALFVTWDQWPDAQRLAAIWHDWARSTRSAPAAPDDASAPLPLPTASGYYDTLSARLTRWYALLWQGGDSRRIRSSR